MQGLLSGAYRTLGDSPAYVPGGALNFWRSGYPTDGS